MSLPPAIVLIAILTIGVAGLTGAARLPRRSLARLRPRTVARSPLGTPLPAGRGRRKHDPRSPLPRTGVPATEASPRCAGTVGALADKPRFTARSISAQAPSQLMRSNRAAP